MNRPLLFNPVPVTLSERVRNSLLLPDLCHREGEFFDLQDEIRERLFGVYGLDPAGHPPFSVRPRCRGTARAVPAPVSGPVRDDSRVRPCCASTRG